MTAPSTPVSATTERPYAPRPGWLARIRLYGLSPTQLAWTFFLPTVIVICAVLGYPAVRVIWMSLHLIRLDEPWLGQPWVGLKNYDWALHNGTFWSSLATSLYFTVGSVLAETVLGLVIALVVNESFPGRGVMRAAMLVPWAIPAIVSARIWQWMYTPVVGPFNGLLSGLHITNAVFDPLSSPTQVMPAMILADTWKNAPFTALLLLAGLQLIPAELYEAAHMDGASAIARFRVITIPLLKGSLVVALLFRTLTAFQTFDLAKGLTDGGPGIATELLALHAYRVMFSFVNFGRGAALAVLMTLVCAVITIVYASQLKLEEA